MNNNNSQFDKKLHDRLSNEELPFDSMAWEMMEEKLDEKPKRRYLFWITKYRYLLGSLSILLIAAITYWSFHYNNIQDRGHSEVVSIDDSMSNPTLDMNTTSDTSTYTAIPSVEISPTTNNTIKSAPNYVFSPQQNSKTIRNPVSGEANNLVTRKMVTKNVIKEEKEEEQTNDVSTYDPIIGDTNEITSGITNIEQTKISESVHNFISEEIKTLDNIEIEELSILNNTSSSIFTYNRKVVFNANIVEVVQKIDRPKHQINMTIGAGMTQVDIDDPFVGNITPTAIAKQEIFLSLSYLYRMHRNWGIEIGAQAAYQSQKIGHYFREGDFDFSVSEYGRVHVNAYDSKYELFSNIHFLLPLNQRSELDIYGGFYALNPFSETGAGGFLVSAGTRSILNNNDITLIRSRVIGDIGIFNGGRMKLGFNYNFLTNKLNNVGIGIAYMQEINNVFEGTYYLIQNSEETRVLGNLRTNPSGFKVQMTYGFGMKKFPWSKKTLNSPSPKTPWYVGVRYGNKSYIYNDDLTKDLVSANTNKYQSISVGHYIKQKMAFEFGLEYSEFVFSTPFGNNSFGSQQQKVLSAPFALRYDLIQTDRLSLYGKGVFSTDFRILSQNPFTTSGTGFVTDENNLLLSTGIEAGLDFRIFSGVNLGVVGKYNHAFSRTALVQFPELSAQNEIIFRDINLKNTYFSWGVELKYLFNRRRNG